MNMGVVEPVQTREKGQFFFAILCRHPLWTFCLVELRYAGLTFINIEKGFHLKKLVYPGIKP